MSKLPTSIRSYAERIQGHWHNATESILEVARLCAEANDRLSAPDKKQLLEALPFSSPTFSKLAQIGTDRRLQSTRVQKLLPPNYSIIYSVAQLEDADFKTAIKEGIVNPTMKRADLQTWIEDRDPGDKPPKPRSVNLPNGFFAAIKLLKELSPREVERLNELLDQVRLEFNAEIVRPRDRMERYAKAIERWHNRVLDHMRKGARRLVREMKQRALNRSKKWVLTWDETFIDHDAAERRIQEVLDMIGREDELNKLREAAYAEVEQPTPPKLSESAPDTQWGLEEVARQIQKRRRRKAPNPASFLDFN
jgi:hypothetical protein